jgi:hypothetical protein
MMIRSTLPLILIALVFGESHRKTATNRRVTFAGKLLMRKSQ